jgi:uncharacterized protein YjbJ (UPF0337 family)
MAVDPALPGQWNEFRDKVKEKWGILTDDDLEIRGGNFDELIGRIQTKTGEGRDEIEGFFGGSTANGSAALARASEATRECAERAGEQFHTSYRRVEGMVLQRPGSIVASAFSIGIFVGVLSVIAVRRR